MSVKFAEFTRRISQVVALLVSDLLAYYVALLAAIWLRINVYPIVFPVPLPKWPFGYASFLDIWWLPASFIFALAYEGMYARRVPFWEEARILIKGVSLATLVGLSIVSLGKLSEEVSRLVLVSLWVISLWTFPLLRWASKKLLFQLGIWKEKVLIIGAGDGGVETLRGLVREQHLGYDIIGFLDDDPSKIGTQIQNNGRNYKVFGRIDQFHKFVRIMNISTIIIAIPSLSTEKLAQIVTGIHRHVKRVLLVPELKGVALLNTELSVLFMEQLFFLNIRNNLKSLTSRTIKQTFDLVVGPILALMFLPVFGLLYLAVKLTSPGGAFYTQDRLGKNSKIIKIYKFRSMYIDGDQRLEKALQSDPKLRQEWQTYFKLKSYDPRVTSVGRFLRKWSLDETPQLFNVIKGDMSLVGPRPYLPSEQQAIGSFSDVIHMARPGLCGLWQASGRCDLSFKDRLRLDAWYVLNWSVWLDILLLFKTIRAVISAKGAY